MKLLAGSQIRIQHADIPIAISARRSWKIRLVKLIVFALVEAREGGHLIVDLTVDLSVVLVAVVAIQQQCLVIVRACRAIGSGKSV